MLVSIKQHLSAKVDNGKLIESLFESYLKISNEYICQNPVGLLQNLGLFVESSLRVAEHLILGQHTPLSKEIKAYDVQTRLEKASGSDGIRIHLPRLARAVFDFRTRKTSVHLKDIDPILIDAHLVYNVCTWILIELLKESGIQNAEGMIKLLFTRKVPLVQSVGGILRTTNPKLMGPDRILLLLYASPSGLDEDELLSGTRTKIKSKSHLVANLRNLESRDLVHNLGNGTWQLFGQGFSVVESLIGKHSFD